MAAASSPASSPRLPSPPPIAEDQIGPTSPGLQLFEDHGKLLETGGPDIGSARRIRPGTKAEDMTEGPPLVDLQDIDSAFQLTEHLKALYFSNTHPSDSNSTVPVTAALARELSQPPPHTSKEIWLYELGRFLIQKTNSILVALFEDNPPCSALTCPEMRASEWQYLCAVHDPPKSCAAIDYCCHTLDWAATSLTSSKMFPSRLGLGSGSVGVGNDKVLQQQMKELTSIFRRVYRIYAHAWFQHREMFWRVESKTGLYIFFKTICDEYGIMQPENYTVPSEAEGREPELHSLDLEENTVPSILKRESGDTTEEGTSTSEPAGNSIIASGDTTKRHRHTRSDMQSTVTSVIQEEAEEDDQEPLTKPGLARAATVLQDPGTTPEEQPTGVIEEPENDEEGEGEEPAVGIARSDTIKAPKEAEEPQDVEVTVIATEAEDEPEETPQEATTELVESVDPQADKTEGVAGSVAD